MNLNLTTTDYFSPRAWGLHRYADFTMDDGALEMMLQGWPIIFAIISAYLTMVFSWKPRKAPQSTALQHFLFHRLRMDLRTIRHVWNCLLALYSVLGSVHLLAFCAYQVSIRGLYAVVCEPEEAFFRGPVGFWNLLFTLGKIFELGDTVFILLSGRTVILLHWFHHATVLPWCWYALSSKIPYHNVGVTLNYTVHAFMYMYFALNDATTTNLADGGFRQQWGKRITTLQCTQFVLMLIVMAVAAYDKVFYGNPYIPYLSLTISISVVATYLILFLQFAETKYGFYIQLKHRMWLLRKQRQQQQQQKQELKQVDSDTNDDSREEKATENEEFLLWHRSDLTLEQRFDTATKMAAMLSFVATTDELLTLYACYKQCKNGALSKETYRDLTTGTTAAKMDERRERKIQAWWAVRGLTTEEAQERYMKTLDILAERSKQQEEKERRQIKGKNQKILSTALANVDDVDEPLVLYPIRIVGHGTCIPRRIVTNREIEQMGGFEISSQEQKRTGVCERRFADIDGGESLIENGAEAIRAACTKAGISVEDLDLIVGGFGGHQFLPDDACLVQRELGLGESGIRAFTVHATCLSFVVALEVAGSLMRDGRYVNVAVFASSIASVGLNRRETHTAGLFGDGAAAVILQPSPEFSASAIHGFHMETYGCGWDACQVEGGGSYRPKHHPRHEECMEYFSMDGAKTMSIVSKYLRGGLQRFMPGLDRGLTDLSLSGRNMDIDWVVPHQASGVGLDSLGLFAWPEHKVLRTLHKYGNTIAASIPLTLCDGIDNGKIKRGDNVLLCGTSAGISMGLLLLTY